MLRNLIVCRLPRLVAGMILAGLVVIPVPGQSGRGRPATPAPPKPPAGPANPVANPAVLGIPEGGKLTRQESAGGTGRSRLRNELTILIRERHAVPLVTVGVVVKAGWADEPSGQAGVAQLTQELLRGGADGNGVTVEMEVARLGGRLLGEVGAHESRLQIVAPAESYARAVELLAGMIQRTDFSAEQVARAARLADLRGTAAATRLEEAAVDRLRGRTDWSALSGRVTSEQARSFRQQFYHPGNMVVVVVGDIFSLPALGQIQLRFGGLAARPQTSPPAEAPAKERPAEGLRYYYGKAPIHQSLVAAGYRLAVDQTVRGSLPLADSLKERATLEVLTAVLGLGRASRLHQGLREGLASRDRTSVVSATRSEVIFDSPAGTADTGNWLITLMAVEPARIDRAEAEFFREIERLRREIISEAELQRAITMLEKRHYDEIETIEAEASRLATSQLQDGDYRIFDGSIARQRKVTAAEVQQAAARYLSLTQLAIAELEPLGAPPRTFTPESFSDLVTTFAPGASRPVVSTEVKAAPQLRRFTQGAERVVAVDEQNVLVAPIPLPVRDFSVFRGPRAYVREDKSRPIVTVTIVFQGGRLQETSQTSGMTELMLRSMLKSTTTRRADLIAHELESYGAEVRIVNQPDFYGFTIEVLSRNTEAAVKVLLELIESPFFDPEETRRELGILLIEQQGGRDQLPLEATERFLGSIYPNHPYALPRLGQPTAIGGMGGEKLAERLEQWHASSIRRQYPFVFLVGDTDGSSMVSRIFSDGLKRGELDKTLKVNLPTQFPPARDVAAESGWPLTLQTSGFRLGNQSLPAPGDHLVGAMLAELISSGPLGSQLTAGEGLSLTPAVALTQQLAGSFFSARLAIRPEDETAALDLLTREFQRLTTALPTDEEFELARNAAIGRYAILLQSHTERTLEYARAALIGRKPAEVDGQPEAMIGVRKTDLKRVAESIFRNSASGRGILRGNLPGNGEMTK